MSIENDKCDIVYKNRHFESIERFLLYLEEVA